jgi:predicted DNA-binding transcriptional regulator YafY|tara:strand:+ start:4824 stop:5222 length:399 start_codon:yes stop_codon:yes gene_type:complete
VKLYNVISTLIFEQASSNEVVDAIKNKHVCELEYQDDSSIGPGRRVIYPVAFGDSLRGNKVVRAYQVSGPSLKVNEEGIPLPDWRLFRTDRINSFKPRKGEDDSVFETFNEPPLYNPFGDKSMNRVLVNSKF